MGKDAKNMKAVDYYLQVKVYKFPNTKFYGYFFLSMF